LKTAHSLKKEAVSFSKTSATIYQQISCPIPEDFSLQQSRCWNRTVVLWRHFFTIQIQLWIYLIHSGNI